MPGVYSTIPKYFTRGKKKVIATLHEWSSMHILRKGSIFPLSLLNDGLIFVSPKEQLSFNKTLMGRINRNNNCVIPIGVNLSIPILRDNEILSTRKELLNWNEIKVDIVLGFFGFIYDWKQPYEMLNIIKHLHDIGIKTRLVIAGEFPEDHITQKRKFIEKINELKLSDYIILKGFIEDEEKLATLLSACNLALLLYSDGVTTRRNSFWYVLELGIPIITTAPDDANEFEGYS